MQATVKQIYNELYIGNKVTVELPFKQANSLRIQLLKMHKEMKELGHATDSLCMDYRDEKAIYWIGPKRNKAAEFSVAVSNTVGIDS